MRRFLVFLILAASLGGAGYWYLHLRTPATATRVQSGGGRRGGPSDNASVVPVLTTQAQQRDVPIFLDGLGTAQASATVTVRPQVDGKLIEVDFVEGMNVKAGQVLARIDPRGYQAALDQAVAKKAQDAALLANARLDSARYAKLAATAYTSAQQADTAKSLVAQYEAQIAGDQALIDTARVNLSYTTITAPIDGRIGIRQVDVGNIVHASDTTGISVITTLQPIAVLFTLPQQSLGAVTEAMQAGPPEVLAVPPDVTGTILDRGQLMVLDNQVDPATGTIKLKAIFPNTRLQLWPGAFVNVRLKVETRVGAITVPPVALQRGPTGAFVYIANADNTASRRQVIVAHEDLTVAIISDGLKTGERVVIDGASRLQDGTKITIADPAPAPQGPTPVAGPKPRPRSTS